MYIFAISVDVASVVVVAFTETEKQFFITLFNSKIYFSRNSEKSVKKIFQQGIISPLIGLSLQ
jgi:hypothetical protein